MSLNTILATAPLTTTNYVIKATGTALGNSIIYDNGTNVGIGNTNTSFTLDVSGTGRFTGIVTFGSTLSNGTYAYTLPSATGTLALVGGSGVGTVTSVAALTIGTTGTDLSSTVATSTTTPVITLNVPTASAANRGALASADWTTFNNKQGTITLTTTGTSGAATFSANTLNIPQYQGVLTNPVTGTGTTNYLPKFTGTSTIGNSLVYDNASFVGINTTTNGGILSINGTDPLIGFQNLGSTKWQVGLENTASDRFVWYNNAGAAYRMMLTASGNLGLGVTPFDNSLSVGLDIGIGAGLFGYNNRFILSANAYYNVNWKYKATAAAAVIKSEVDSSIQFLNAPSGTAGAAITFTQAMTLFSTGNLAIATTTDAGYKLDVNGTGRFSGNFTVFSSATGATTGDLLVDTSAKYVYVGRLSGVSGDNTTFQVRDRVGTARATIPGGGSIDTVFSTNSSNFIVTNYSATALMTIANSGAATFSSSVTATGGINGYSGLNGYAGVTHNFFVDWSAESQVTTLTATNLFFGTNAIRRLTIQSGGNVLIGTTTDDTVNKLQVEGSASIKSFIKLNTLEAPSVSTSAVTISTVNNTYGGIAIVWGNNSGNIFTDLVFYSLSSTYVINGQSVSGSPVGRTYTCVSGDLKLAMASGTYSVRFQAIVTT